MNIFIIIPLVFIFIWIYWRYYYFFRDPERKIPKGNNIVSPADGRIEYVKKIKKNIVPISVKKKKSIKLTDICKTRFHKQDKYLIGVFMTPFDVHVNRSPIKGKVEWTKHYKHKLLPMTKTWIDVMFNIRPYYKGSAYLTENERKITLVKGKFPIFIIQIADTYVKKIVGFVKKNDSVEKGQRIGLIRMGSQVDIIFPYNKNFKIKVKEGDKVKAGESIIATY
tara:strand:+ start:10047 stop:10715 length:669 start_codon:yes stop_codon:yes gene_type:complete